MKLLFTSVILFVMLPFALLGQVSAPISIQGFNHDVIAEGTGHSSMAKTTMAMDVEVPSNNVMCTKQFAKANGLPAGYGIPDNGVIANKRNRFNIITSGQNNNTLFVRKGETGELKLNNPSNFSLLSILGLATEGEAFFHVTLHFADFTKLVYRGHIFADWFDGINPFYSGFGRIKRVSPSPTTPLSFEGAPLNPNLYVLDLDLPKEKILSSVSFQNVSMGENLQSNRLFIFAFSGVTWKPEVVKPTPTAEQKPVEEKVVIPTPVSTEITIQGKIQDSKTNKPIQAKIQFSGNISLSRLSSTDGDYEAIFPEAGEYAVKIESAGYISLIDKIDLNNSPRKGLNYLLVPIEKGTRVNLKNVLFQQGTPILLNESYKELDLVVDLMINNPTLKIELSGHTDNVGSASLNLKLSNNRVIAVKEYLVAKGIDGKRIKGKGYGGTKPISPGDTEEARRLNRRVEFIITQL